MRSAPPVVYPVGRFLWSWPVALLLLALLSAWIWQPWQMRMPREGFVWWGSLALQGLLLLWLGVLYRRPVQQVRALRWDGEFWYGETAAGPSMPVVLQVHADLQNCLWLAVKTASSSSSERRASLWICARATAKPAAWHGFRCAVYCRSRSPASVTG